MTAGDRKGRPYGVRRSFPIPVKGRRKCTSSAAGAGAFDSPAVFLKVLMRLWANTYKKACVFAQNYSWCSVAPHGRFVNRPYGCGEVVEYGRGVRIAAPVTSVTGAQ